MATFATRVGISSLLRMTLLQIVVAPAVENREHPPFECVMDQF
jgi:hypothetical protein